MRHPDAATLSAQEVDQLVAYLRTRRKMWAIEPGERSRDIAPATENAAFFNRAERDSEERPERLIGALDISPGATLPICPGTGYFTWVWRNGWGRPQGPPSMQQSCWISQRQWGTCQQRVKYWRPADPRLPEQALDLVFIACAYHELAIPRPSWRR
jgi:hypothetical protein